MIEEDLQELIQKNKASIQALIAVMRSDQGIIPFVGAGLSIPLGYPSWPDFLVATAELCGVAGAIAPLIADERCDEAADLLAKQMGEDAIHQLIDDEFADATMRSHAGTAVAVVPQITTGPVITLNFDHVLERVFEYVGRPFERVVCGPDRDAYGRALDTGLPWLLKLHGDASDRTRRLFRKSDYDRENGAAGALAALERIAAGGRLLFLGCSLRQDRFLTILEGAVTRQRSIRNFAILERPPDEQYVRRRRRLSAIGVMPIWLPRGRYNLIRPLLTHLDQEVSTPPPPREVSSTPAQVEPMAQPVAPLRQALPTLTVPRPTPAAPREVGSTQLPEQPVARAIPPPPTRVAPAARPTPPPPARVPPAARPTPPPPARVPPAARPTPPPPARVPPAARPTPPPAARPTPPPPARVPPAARPTPPPPARPTPPPPPARVAPAAPAPPLPPARVAASAPPPARGVSATRSTPSLLARVHPVAWPTPSAPAQVPTVAGPTPSLAVDDVPTPPPPPAVTSRDPAAEPVKPTASSWVLRFISGKYQGGEFPLRPNREVIIGRSADADMVLAEDLTSRRHAKVVTDDDTVTLHDLGSTNGSFVNAERIRSVRLQDGDRILIGTSIMKLVRSG